MVKVSKQAYRRLRYNLTKQQTEEKAQKTLRNNRNRKVGELFQTRLDGYHVELKTLGLATVYRTQPEVKIQDFPHATVTGKGPVDYLGFISRGRTIHFDAKARAQDFTLGDDMMHQDAWLRTMHRLGHIAGLFVWWHQHDECRWHPVDTFDRRVRRNDGILVPGIEWLQIFK